LLTQGQRIKINSNFLTSISHRPVISKYTDNLKFGSVTKICY
jgi:hypothetical protein